MSGIICRFFNPLNPVILRKTMRKVLQLLFLTLIIAACDEPKTTPNDFNKIAPLLSQGVVNMVIEIPAGSNQKWEVNKQTGHLEWQQIGDSLRVINYLPYPANYGMVPGTYLPKALGGDDDPLDIFLLGPSLKRGSVHPAKVIGVIKILDRGEQDDKLVAVDPESWFGHIRSIAELEKSYPGSLSILITWLQSYKGQGIVEYQNIEDRAKAIELIHTAVDSFEDNSSQ